MSSNELAPQQTHAVALGGPSPFQRSGLPSAVNAGAVAIEQERAIAEVQGQIIVAQRCPRDLLKAHSELMTACKSKAFAGVAFYTVPNRGTGPSIRFAEEVARVFGNFQYGHRELSRDDKKSEVEVFAWDVEKNNRSIRQLTVMHVIDTKQGPKPCRDQADVDNKIANVASKQVRGRILALMPKYLVEDAIQECRKTLAGANTDPIEVRVRRMVEAFKSKYGVTVEMIEGYMKKKSSEFVTDDLVDLQGVYNALKEGARASEYFGADAQSDAEDAGATDAVLKAGQTLAANQAAKPAAATPPPPPPPAQEKPAEAAASAPATQTSAPAAAPATRARRTPPAPPAPAPAAAAPEPEQQASSAPAEQDPPPDNAGGPPPNDGDPGAGPEDFF